MAKKYDFERAKQIIESRKDEIQEAHLGMYEDWFWTAETVFKDGEYQVDLDKVKLIAGITGSYWATPTLMLELKDGKSECIPCYIGQSDREQPTVPVLGPLSEAVQNNMPPLTFKADDNQ